MKALINRPSCRLAWFGALLADEQLLTLIVAGRSLEKARAFCAARTNAVASLQAARFDRDGETGACPCRPR